MLFRSLIFFFFFLISKNVINTNDYSMHEEHRANPENTRRKKQKRKLIHKLITKRKRATERMEKITNRESPSPRPIKKSPTKRSKHLITRTIQILKSPPILVPSKYTKRCTTELNPISKTSASPTNSTSQKENLGSI